MTPGGGQLSRIKTLVVAKSGGDFSSIQGAINSVPDNNSQWVYREHLFVGKSYIAFVGESRENTRLEYA